MNKKISKCALCGSIAQAEEAPFSCYRPWYVCCTNLYCGNGTAPNMDRVKAIHFWNENQAILEKGLRFDEYKAIVDASSEHSRGGRL